MQLLTCPHRCLPSPLARLGSQGHGVLAALPARLSPPCHSVPPPAPCLAAPLPCAAACTGLSGVNHVAKRPGCVLLAGGRREAACTGTNADTEGRQRVYSWCFGGRQGQRGLPHLGATQPTWGQQGAGGCRPCSLQLEPRGGSPGGWRGWGHTQGTRGWPQGAELSLHRPCPAGRSEMALCWPQSRCPHHVPSSRWSLVQDGAGGGGAAGPGAGRSQPAGAAEGAPQLLHLGWAQRGQGRSAGPPVVPEPLHGLLQPRDPEPAGDLRGGGHTNAPGKGPRGAPLT